MKARKKPQDKASGDIDDERSVGEMRAKVPCGPSRQQVTRIRTEKAA